MLSEQVRSVKLIPITDQRTSLPEIPAVSIIPGMSGSSVTLNIIAKEQLLARSPYFIGLSTNEMKEVSHLTFERQVGRGEIVTLEGGADHNLYLVASGALKIYNTSSGGKEQIVSLVRPGDSFNDVAAFDSGTVPATVQSLTPALLYYISGPALLERACRLSGLASNIARLLAGRVRDLSSLVADLSFRPVAGRLARILLDQINREPAPYLTQKDLASMAGTAREVVARALKSLEDEGIIRVDRHKIVIKDRVKLEDKAA
ncbi:cAMP-binding protein [Dehalogenimonas alkenigignens]|uniref:cAMP-binding protein n=2 Tax=Dehalogenimonas alkenigignens TaxID=1217799 RepID=A0A0W0GJ18_9CHLR|nr:cAMP-binding protein [Dehalogenimonas alkenigignens]